MKRIFSPFAAGVLFVATAIAQVTDAPAPAAPAPAAPAPAAPAPAAAPAGGAASNPAAGPSNNFLGKDVPFLDPAGEILSWDGKHWSVNNNRLFSARFEKYLNAEAETNDAAVRYRAIVKAIIDKLSPYHLSPGSLDEAFRMLPQASSYEMDANLSDSLASSVYSVWQARREDQRLLQANDALEQERRTVQRNAEMTATDTNLSAISPKANGAEQAQWAKQQEFRRTIAMEPYVSRLAEIKALTKANQAKQALSELQTKIEFQALIVQFVLQRRFQHVLLATQVLPGSLRRGRHDLEGRQGHREAIRVYDRDAADRQRGRLPSARGHARRARGRGGVQVPADQERTGKRHQTAFGGVRGRRVHAGTCGPSRATTSGRRSPLRKRATNSCPFWK